ncbi:MAG: hypothetical protein AAF171_04180 [Cyanobacteria bacterium P01_A01_bin.116]
MLSINLDDEAERYLVGILKEEEITISELLKQLLKERLSVHQPKQTVLERMGGVPKHLLSVGDLSDRDNRKAIIAEHIQARHKARHE